MCKKILAHGITTLHLYTLNVDKSAIGILMVVPHFLQNLLYITHSIVDTGEPNIGAEIAEPWFN